MPSRWRPHAIRGGSSSLENYLNPNKTSAIDRAPAPLEQALKQSQEVKSKIKDCAVSLSAANTVVKLKIADGVPTVSAHKVLKAGEALQRAVQECADVLHEFTALLSDGIDHLQRSEVALVHAQAALADAEAALEASRKKEREATGRSLHDVTTGLPNRLLFNDRLSQAIAMAERQEWAIGVLLLDLDQFECVDDTHGGHAVGDAVLKEIARRLQGQVREADTVCRNGRDDFLCLLMNPGDRANVERMAGLMLACTAEPIEVGKLEFIVKSSVGIAVFPEDGRTVDALIEKAGAAMYRAK